MRINYITGRTLIEEIYDEFNLKSDDWVNRVPNWINKGLKELNNGKVYVNMIEQGQFNNHTIILPEYIEGQIALLKVNDQILIDTYHVMQNGHYNYPLNDPNNMILPIVSNDNTFNANNALTRDEAVIPNIINTNIEGYHHKHEYYIEDNKIITRKQYGNYKIWYKTIPIEFDDKLQTYIPLIPNLQKVITNLKWYIFTHILSRGLIHPIYSLGARDIEYDPKKQWKISSKAARIELSQMDINDRNEIANVNMSFFSLPAYKMGQVNNIFELFNHHGI
jgi:hypothetical protein